MKFVIKQLESIGYSMVKIAWSYGHVIDFESMPACSGRRDGQMDR